MNKKQSAIAEVAKFYLDSNYLTTGGKSYDIYDWSEGIEIELYNHKNGNVSAVDVEYEVTVTNGTSNISSGTILAGQKNMNTIHITPANGVQTVTVSVTTTLYDFTIFATFNLEEIKSSPYYTFTDEGSYCELIIRTSKDVINNIDIVWDTLDYAPDNTNLLMESWTSSPGTISSLGANSTYTLIFFKNRDVVVEDVNSEIQNNEITLP